MATAAAVVGAAIIGAVSASRSAKKGASAAKKASRRITSAGALAREDVLREIPEAQRLFLAGAGGAFDIFQEAIPIQQRQISAGSQAAQRSTGLGFQQAQQALLGGAVQPFSVSEVDFSPRPFQRGRAGLRALGRNPRGPAAGSQDPQVESLRSLVLPSRTGEQFTRLGLDFGQPSFGQLG